MPRSKSGQSQELGIQSSSPMWVTEIQVFESSPLPPLVSRAKTRTQLFYSAMQASGPELNQQANIHPIILFSAISSGVTDHAIAEAHANTRITSDSLILIPLCSGDNEENSCQIFTITWRFWGVGNKVQIFQNEKWALTFGQLSRANTLGCYMSGSKLTSSQTQLYSILWLLLP